MAKLGRNDPCHCGTGLKYKKCCLEKDEKQQQVLRAPVPASMPPRMGREDLDEGNAFSALLTGSEAFRRYYEKVRPSLPPFRVVYDPDIPKGIRARVTRMNGAIYLRLRTRVCPVEDAALIAHELGHMTLDAQGFPVVGGLNDHSAAAALNSAFQDPLIDASLRPHGFDRAAERAAETKESRRQLERHNGPADPGERALWIANFLGCILDRKVLGDEPATVEFGTWFSSRFPEIASEAKRIADSVAPAGFDTPDKMLVALDTARTMLGAGGGVISPPHVPLRG
jgi:hypothetical protein